MSEEKSDNWEMPKPVFRQTSGSRPKGFAKTEENWDSMAPDVKAPDADNAILSTLYAPPDDLPEESPIVPAAAPGVDIEPQPSITEQFTIEEAPGVPAAKVKPKRGVFGNLFLLLGVLIMLVAVAGVIVLIYYLFFCEQECRQWFDQFYSPR